MNLMSPLGKAIHTLDRRRRRPDSGIVATLILEDLREEPLFDVVVETLAACADTRRPEEVLCEGVAKLLEGELAAYVDLTTPRPEVVSWPPGADTSGLLTRDSVLTRLGGGVLSVLSGRREPTRDGRGEPGTARGGPPAAETLAVSLTADEHPRRLLVVVRPDGFSDAQLSYLGAALPLLAALDRHLQHRQLRHLPAPPAVAAGPVGRTSGMVLTARESEVLELLATGLLASSIASTLGVSSRTVHAHLAHIYRKLNTNDRLSAVNKARAFGLIPAT